MVDGVDSQPLKTQRIQNSDSGHDTRYTNTDILSITKNNSLRNVIRSHYLYCSCLPLSKNYTLTKKMLFAELKRPY